MALFADRINAIDTENAFKVGPYIKEVESTGMKVVKCNIGEPDFPTPKHIIEEVKRQLDLDNTHYNDPQGVLPFRETIAKQISETRNIKVTPDHVVVFPGGKPPIGLCQQAYCNPGDEIIYPSPGFPIYESFIEYFGAVPKPLHLNEEKNFSFTGADLEALITDKTKLIFINFPSNPTGGVASPNDLREMAEVIKKKCNPDVRIYSDEIYENILFDGSKHSSIASVPGMQERTIIVSGASKSFSWTGGRIGWAVFPTVEEAQAFKNLNINYFSCIPPYNQMGAKLAIESPLSKPEIDKMNTAFQERRDVVVDGLNNIDGITCQKPKGAFYVFPNIEGMCKNLGAMDAYSKFTGELQHKSSPSTLVQMFLLFKYGVASMDRKSFGRIGTERLHYLRLSIATSMEELKEGLKRIKEATNDKEGFAKFVAEGKRLY